MFQAGFGAVPRSLRSSRQTSPAAWEQAWRRLFTSQTGHQALQRSQRTIRSLPSSFRFGLTRPSFATGQTVFRGPQKRGFRFSSWRRNMGNAQGVEGAEENLSLTGKFRKLTREYGRAAVGIYFLLSILDYPFFFLLVKAVGTDRIGKVEAHIVSAISSVVPEPIRIKVRETWESVKDSLKGKEEETDEMVKKVEGWGVEEAQERNAEEASLGTQLALAYAIHKSFFFVRIPLTIAVTPKIVKQLRAWGWNIGKQITKRK